MIYTVTGPVKKDELGLTLAHEHLAWDSRGSYQLYFDKVYDEERVEELYQLLLPVLQQLYQQGCRAIAETTIPIGGQNLLLMRKLSLASGIKIIPNTGMSLTKYTYQIHRADFAKELAVRWIADFAEGLDTLEGVVIRPSHLKLFVTDSSHGVLPAVDREMLRAAVRTSKVTGLPIHCHILEAKSAEAVMELLVEEGCDFSRFLWAHAGYEMDNDVIGQALAKGAWVGFDMIQPGRYPGYFALLKAAIDRGYQERIILSQDYDFLEQVEKCGAEHPCTSLLTEFIPYCEGHGLSEQVIRQILTENPANFYDVI